MDSMDDRIACRSSRATPTHTETTKSAPQVDRPVSPTLQERFWAGRTAQTRSITPRERSPACDGVIDISDPVWTIGYLFLGGPAPPAPFPD
jgi:hypothetical protein